MRTTRLLLTTAALAFAVTSACGGDGEPAGVASLSDSTTTTTPTGPGGGSAATGLSAAFEDAMVAFAECMREHGIDFPDPASGDGGALLIGPDSDIDPEDPDFKAAEAECKPILDAAEATMPKPSEAEIAEMRDSMLAFAECMRDEGIDMPDPEIEPGGRAAIRMGDPNDPDVKAAQEACSKKTGGIGIGMAGGAGAGAGAKDGK